VPYSNWAGNCQAASSPNNDPSADKAVSTTSHELIEEFTNPTKFGWFDANGLEIADKCQGSVRNGAWLDRVRPLQPVDQRQPLLPAGRVVECDRSLRVGRLMATVIIKKSAAIVFVGRYLTLADRAEHGDDQGG
jgi:hypothetical protein